MRVIEDHGWTIGGRRNTCLLNSLIGGIRSATGHQVSDKRAIGVLATLRPSGDAQISPFNDDIVPEMVNGSMAAPTLQDPIVALLVEYGVNLEIHCGIYDHWFVYPVCGKSAPMVSLKLLDARSSSSHFVTFMPPVPLDEVIARDLERQQAAAYADELFVRNLVEAERRQADILDMIRSFDEERMIAA